MSISLSRRAALIASAAGIGACVAACANSGPTSVGEAGEVLGTFDDFADDAFVTTTDNGADIVVVREGDDIRAFNARCPHSGCIVRKKDGKLDCPCHGSLFNATTGAVERGPAKTDLAPVAITVDGETISLG